jgi:hypothetical protein
MCGVFADAEREAAVAAAELEHPLIAEVGESTQRREVSTLRIEQLGQCRRLTFAACRPSASYHGRRT